MGRNYQSDWSVEIEKERIRDVDWEKEASTKTLYRPLRLSDSITSVSVSIQSSSPNHPNQNPDLDLLIITVHDLDSLTSPDRQAILDQVRRMLRISERDEREVHQFQEKHPEAKKSGFGRLFRSPSLFEDAVKSILLCNSEWLKRSASFKLN
ncbi:hypothetical protein Tsubulata_048375 [Turnera subulata]|uniref:Uncharacterized protein n=1 Tax=Turnera subulata TaxID=218843 RepID=A0A9Q0FVG7_9ROSI|nr:hypothetical protein Tsubulata_048375 [Turnera subulata]